MAQSRRSFQRPLGERRYRTLFVIAVEGERTEVDYFRQLPTSNTIVRIEVLPGSGQSSPPQVLARLRSRLQKESLRTGDEAWIVIDRDQWKDAQILPLHAWSQEDQRFAIAVSNPSFEWWLLLHFEEPPALGSKQACVARLRRHLPRYDKSVPVSVVQHDRIERAIDRARRRDQPPCDDWPRQPGSSTVYRLVERILRLG